MVSVSLVVKIRVGGYAYEAEFLYDIEYSAGIRSLLISRQEHLSIFIVLDAILLIQNTCCFNFNRYHWVGSLLHFVLDTPSEAFQQLQPTESLARYIRPVSTLCC